METYITFLLNVTINISAATSQRAVVSNRVINGYKVDITEVPYQASIHRQNYSGWWYLCGAVIIHEKALLTAAHCIDQLIGIITKQYGKKPDDITIYMRINVGRTLINTGGTNYRVSKVITHQNFSMHPIQADIAFIVLVDIITFNEEVKFVPHAPKDYEVADGTEAIVSGFGTTSFLFPQHSVVLQAAKVYITNQKICANAYNPFSSLLNINHGIICAHATKPPRDACAGDSGGPLVADGYLIGIVSFGVGCAHPEYPGVYSRVSYFYDWIENNLDNELTTGQLSAISFNISTRVVNGNEVEISEVPYQASIHVRNDTLWWYLCGAVIIHEKAVLTAAHCIDELTEYLTKENGNKTIEIIQYLRINVGRTVIHFGGDNYNVNKIIKYQDSTEEPIMADIAIIVLMTNIKFSKRINKIPYAPKDYVVTDGTEAIVSGFGRTSFIDPFSTVLQAAKVYITNLNYCTHAYSQLKNITHSVLCAEATEPPRGPCTGDSGGPLVANGYLIGIVSFGVKCVHPKYPGVYTRVSYFYDWIQTNLDNERIT